MKRIIIALMLIAGVARGQGWESATMTDSNAPLPVVVTADIPSANPYQSWQAFRRNGDTTWWNTDNATTPHYTIYDCGSGNSNRLGTITICNYPSYGFSSFSALGSQDASTWSLLITTNLSAGSAKNIIYTGATSFYRYYMISNNGSLHTYGAVAEIELSSADYNGAAMTSDTAPSPYVVGANATNGANSAWKAFNRDTVANNYWQSWGVAPPLWIQQDFGSNVVINGFTYRGIATIHMKHYSLSGSTNGTNFTEMDTGTFADISATQLKTNSNTTAYRYVRLTSTNFYDMATYNVAIEELTFKHYPVASISSPPPTPRPFLLRTKDNKIAFRVKKGSAVAPSYFTRWQTPIMTDSNAPSPIFTSSSPLEAAGYPFWKAFDGIFEPTYIDIWYPDVGGNPWWSVYDCGAGQSNALASMYYLSYAQTDFKNFTIAGSQDGTTYTTNLIAVGSNGVSELQLYNVTNQFYARYWRVDIADGYSTTISAMALGFGSGRIFIPDMTASNAPSPYVVTTDNDYTADYQGWKLFDRNISEVTGASDGRWISAAGYPHWIRIDLGSNVVCETAVLLPYRGYGFKHCAFKGSTDNANWTYLADTNGLTDGIQIIQSTNATPTAYRYYEISSTNGWNNGNAELYEIILYQSLTQ